MKSMFFVFAALVSAQAYAGDVNLAPGKTATINGTLVSCQSASSSLPDIRNATNEMIVNLAEMHALGSCTASGLAKDVSVIIHQQYYYLNGRNQMSTDEAAEVLRQLVGVGACNY